VPKVRTRANQPKWKQTLSRAVRTLCWTLVIGILALGAFDLYGFLLTSDFFIIRQVDVQGCRLTAPERFIELADIPPGTNIFRLRCQALARRLRRHPWVEQVRVVRILPDTVRIALHEREPMAAINSPFDGQVYGLDRHLVVLPEPAESATEAATLRAAHFDLPIVTGLPAGEIYPGNRLCDPAALKVMETLLLFRTLDARLLQALSEIHIDSQQNLTLYPLRRVQAIYLGNENLHRRAWRLCRVWNYLENHDIDSRYIDCRFDAQGVVTRPENLTQAKWDSLPQADRNLLLAEAASPRDVAQPPSAVPAPEEPTP